ncbi:hypothetical protein RSAG8_08414, partial [Rhizoctonia solani AG-8 WAC10335]
MINKPCLFIPDADANDARGFLTSSLRSIRWTQAQISVLLTCDAARHNRRPSTLTMALCVFPLFKPTPPTWVR